MPTTEIFHKHNAEDISVSKDHGRHVILRFINLQKNGKALSGRYEKFPTNFGAGRSERGGDLTHF